MAKVTIHDKQNLEQALRSLKKQMKREGTLAKCKEKKHYTKPSVKKRLSRNSARKRSTM